LPLEVFYKVKATGGKADQPFEVEGRSMSQVNICSLPPPVKKYLSQLGENA
jgi:hypothetical protein